LRKREWRIDEEVLRERPGNGVDLIHVQLAVVREEVNARHASHGGALRDVARNLLNAVLLSLRQHRG
jgi:hypothetical protein